MDDERWGFNLHTGAASDIRIAISSSHVAPDIRNTSDVRMFDYLIVRAGDRMTGFKFSGLLLLSPAGTAVGRYKVGRDILNSHLSAPSNFAIMRRWLDQCTSEHQLCPDLLHDALLPTRVVDVGGDGADFPPFLLVSNGTARGRYAALTHCWGGCIDIVLTKERLQDFKQRLPVECLAKNFKDALHICRELGVQYLWIDCLCIVQNSEDDWAAESSKMTSIYRNAFVTISALSSRGSSSGIFRDHHSRRSDEWGVRPPPMRLVRDHSLGVTVGLDSSPESGEVAYALWIDSTHDLENLRMLCAGSPLTKRAWCLQESLLSPRIIFFGEEQVYWRCFDGFQSADGLPTGNEFDYPSKEDIHFAYALQGFSEVGMQPPRDRCNNIYDRGGYYHLIRDYSHRSLTKPSDRLPAFSALAERIHANLGGNYLAGLFTANLHSDLLWQRHGPWCIDEMGYPDSPAYVAPSWSWASVYAEVVCASTLDIMCVDHVAPPRKLRLLDSKIRYRDEKNPYGQVLAGSSIVVAGLTTRLMLSKQFARESEGISGQRPKGMCASYLRFDTHYSTEFGVEQVLWAVSSQVSEGETSAQQGRGFFVATKDRVKFEPDDWDFSQPNDSSKHSEVSILPELFMEDEFLILVVTPEDLDSDFHAECLILKKTEQGCDIGQHGQQALAYRRVGILKISKIPEAVDWEEMTLEII